MPNTISATSAQKKGRARARSGHAGGVAGRAEGRVKRAVAPPACQSACVHAPVVRPPSAPRPATSRPNARAARRSAGGLRAAKRMPIRQAEGGMNAMMPPRRSGAASQARARTTRGERDVRIVCEKGCAPGAGRRPHPLVVSESVMTSCPSGAVALRPAVGLLYHQRSRPGRPDRARGMPWPVPGVRPDHCRGLQGLGPRYRSGA